jgi:hypothetical protein
MARAIVGIIVAAILLACAGEGAAQTGDLYQAQTIVTGQGEANRILGFASCLDDVLIKVSGLQSLAGDQRLASARSGARDFVSAFRYHDRMTGISTHDEQGTRDRPYDLIIDFDAAKIDALLGTLGRKPWLARRPTLGMFVGFDLGVTNYVVTSDADSTVAQRESLLAAAARRGMPVVLPSSVALRQSGIDNAKLSTTAQSALAAIASDAGADVALVGQLVWDDRELGWVVQWRMDWQNQPHQWKLRGVTFDEAFRRGIGGAAQILSGNGDPQ